MEAKQKTDETLKAGTGFMPGVAEFIADFEKRGYEENIVPRYDHFECRDGAVKFYPQDFQVDDMARVENASDPADQAVVYAISMPQLGIKGIYVESYGPYQDELSEAMNHRLQNHNH